MSIIWVRLAYRLLVQTRLPSGMTSSDFGPSATLTMATRLSFSSLGPGANVPGGGAD